MRPLSNQELLNRRIDPYWRMARIAARLIMKKDAGEKWSARDRRMAAYLANEPGVTNRLVDQAFWSLTARRKYGPDIMGWFRRS